jgi:hypothetical protein
MSFIYVGRVRGLSPAHSSGHFLPLYHFVPRTLAYEVIQKCMYLLDGYTAKVLNKKKEKQIVNYY